MTSKFDYNGLEIAIIGISVQFAESDTWLRYWENLKAGLEMITHYSGEELLARGVPASIIRNKHYVRSFGSIDNKDCFDAAFFNYSPAEAATMDPQIRLFHQHCWKALEDAGYANPDEQKKIGLFAGASMNDNWKIYIQSREDRAQIDPFYRNILSNQSFISSLVSYKLDLRGPAMYVDTACSTSLTAVHLACRSLLTKECSLALAGGICINTQRQKGYFYEEGMIMSEDGHCRTFDARSTGTVGGEGAGVIVLKRLKDAVQDADHIYAVIRSTAINNDGDRKVGYTAPSVNGQTDCIVTAQRLAGIDAGSIGYVEAHGTATKLGDPVEIRALNEAFRTGKDVGPCWIGSVKSNLGHLDAAAGIASLIKTALSLKYRQIPASLHYSEPNPEIDFKGGPFRVNSELREWERRGNAPLRAGVSSFGVGGTNVHAILEEAPNGEILEEAPRPGEDAPGRAYKLLTVSARTDQALSRYLSGLKAFLLTGSDVNLDDLSYTLQVGRKSFAYRKAIAFKDKEELVRLIDADDPGVQYKKENGAASPVVFVFPGQGSQYAGMGKELYLREPVFREEMDKGFSILSRLTGEDYKEVLYPTNPAGDLRISETHYGQPITFLFEYALARLVMAYGIRPTYMMGHSLGEYVAACISGVFSVEDALELMVKRSALSMNLPEGEMFSIAISEEEAREYLSAGISLAAVNGNSQVVLAGEKSATGDLQAQLERSGTSFVKIKVKIAWHSRSLHRISDAFRTELEKMTFHKPLYPWISCPSGRFITESEAVSPEYWIRQMLQTVRFAEGVKELLSTSNDLVFIELGPGSTLINMIKQQIGDKPVRGLVNVLGHSLQNEESARHFTGRLGLLWALGLNINWHAYHTGERRRRISLPTYSFDPISYPAEVNPYDEAFFSEFNLKSGKNEGLKDWIYYPVWTSSALLPGNHHAMKRKYLFFSSGDDLAGMVKERLCNNGDEVVEICIGKNYEKCPEERYFIAPDSPEDIKRVFQEAAGGEDIIDILYSWSACPLPDRLPLTKEDQALHLVYFTIISIVKELFLTRNSFESRIIILTNALYKVIGNEAIRYSQSPALGLVNIIPQEYSIPCRNIDIDLTDDPRQLAAVLGSEISHIGFNERIVALRSGRRWTREYQRNPVAPTVPREKSVIKKGGVYLLTGGSGNVGFVLAKYLISRYDARVALIGRKKLVPGSEKEGWTGRIRELEALTGNVAYFSADVSDEASFSAAVAAARSKFGNINGVIHAAGNMGSTCFESIEGTTYENTLTVLSPKIAGIENLYSIFKDQAPDFVWITSSLASVLGGLTFGSYAAANLYMEHFIAARCHQLPRWRAVGFSEMAFTPEEVEAENGPVRSRLIPDEITALFEWSLHVEGHPVMYETVGDLAFRLSRAYDRKEKDAGPEREKRKDLFEALGPGKEPGPVDVRNPDAPPGTETEKTIAAIFANFVSAVNIGAEDDFFRLGGDSLKVMLVLHQIKRTFNVAVSLDMFFSNPTVRSVAGRIDEIRALTRKHQDDPKSSTHDEMIPVIRVKDNSYYGITPQQRKEFARFLIIGEYGYNLCMSLEFENLDPAILEKVFDTLFKRHESLRTTFLRVNGEMKQHIHEGRPPGFSIEYIDVRDQEQKEEIARGLYRQLLAMPMNFETGSLIIAKVIRFSGSANYLLVAVHHVHADHQSFQILEREIGILYGSYKMGKEDPLPPLKVQYKDYADWVDRFCQSGSWKRNTAIYRKKIRDHVMRGRSHYPGMSYKRELEDELIHGLQKENIRDYQFAFGTLVNLKPDAGAAYTAYLDEEMVDGLKKLAAENKASLFNTLAAAFSIVFSQLNEDPYVRMYIPISTRVIEEFQHIVGWVMGELILCVRVETGVPMQDLIRRVNTTILEDSDCRFYPYERLMHDLDVPLSVLSPLCFNFISSVETVIDNPVAHHDDQGSGHFNLNLTIIEHSNGISINCEYKKKAYTPLQIEHMLQEFVILLETEISATVIY